MVHLLVWHQNKIIVQSVFRRIQKGFNKKNKIKKPLILINKNDKNNRICFLVGYFRLLETTSMQNENGVCSPDHNETKKRGHIFHAPPNLVAFGFLRISTCMQQRPSGYLHPP